MLAAYATHPSPSEPLRALEVGERPAPMERSGWVTVDIHAAALNHHDLWTLRGVGIGPEDFPMVLGCDAAGVDRHGNEVIVHSVVSDPDWRDDETLDPQRSILSEKYQGTIAEKVSVPARNLVGKPKYLSMEEAACLPTAWLTAYRMLFTQASIRPGNTILVQGVTGGVSSALIALARAAGVYVMATTRSRSQVRYGLDLGAHEVLLAGETLSCRVDAVMETVGGKTWEHSVRSVRDGGTICISGVTSGEPTTPLLKHVFFRQIRVHGSTMGTKAELQSLIKFCEIREIRPKIHSVMSLEETRIGLHTLQKGTVRGKIVINVRRGKDV